MVIMRRASVRVLPSDTASVPCGNPVYSARMLSLITLPQRASSCLT